MGKYIKVFKIILAIILVVCINDLASASSKLSGTKVLKATSGWFQRRENAENYCMREIENLKEAFVNNLKSQGGYVSAEHNDALDCNARTNSEQRDEFQCSTTTKIDWIIPEKEDNVLTSDDKDLVTVVDSDGDGISDEAEKKRYDSDVNLYFNYLIADFPSVSVVPTGDVKIGVDCELERGDRRSAETEGEYLEIHETKKYKKKWNTLSVAGWMTHEVKTGAGSTPEGLVPNFSVDTSLKYEISGAIGIIVSKEKTDIFRNTFKDVNTTSEYINKKISPKAGYIKTSVIVYNPHPIHNVVISKIEYELYGYDMLTGEVDSKPINSGLIELPADKISLESGEKRIIPLNLKDLNTYEIVQSMKTGKSFIIKVAKFNLEVIEFEKSRFESAGLIRSKTFSIRIIDKESDVTYNIARKKPDGTRLSVLDGLKIIFPKSNDVVVDDSGALYTLNGITSNLPLWVKPSKYTTENLSQGRWFCALPKTNTFDGKLNTPISEPGIEATVIYIEGKDLVEKESGAKKIIFEKSVSDLQKEKCIIPVIVGDTLCFDVTVEESLWHQVKSSVKPNKVFLYPDNRAQGQVRWDYTYWVIEYSSEEAFIGTRLSKPLKNIDIWLYFIKDENGDIVQKSGINFCELANTEGEIILVKPNVVRVKIKTNKSMMNFAKGYLHIKYQALKEFQKVVSGKFLVDTGESFYSGYNKELNEHIYPDIMTKTASHRLNILKSGLHEELKQKRQKIGLKINIER